MGDEQICYSDVMSGGRGMKMLVRLICRENARIEAPLIPFKNKDRIYPIRGVSDTASGVAYRTGTKGWMEQTIMKEWLNQPRVIKSLPNQLLRDLFIDNCSGHNFDEDILNAAEAI